MNELIILEYIYPMYGNIFTLQVSIILPVQPINNTLNIWWDCLNNNTKIIIIMAYKSAFTCHRIKNTH